MHIIYCLAKPGSIYIAVIMVARLLWINFNDATMTVYKCGKDVNRVMCK